MLKVIEGFTTPEYRFLSNFYLLPNPIEFQGNLYSSTEAFYQAMKTSNIGVRKEISKMSPSESKEAGRKLLLRNDWEEVKLELRNFIKKFIECLSH